MAQLELPNTIETNTTADAVEVEQNYQIIRSYINADTIRRDGAVSMNAPLQLVGGDPVGAQHAATKGYVDKVTPIGVIMPYAGINAPAGGQWLLCQGQQLATSTYPQLFAVLQFRYGGSGSLFNLPNLNGRFPIGIDSTQTELDTTGKTGGTTVPPLKAHVHSMAHNHGSFASGGQSVTHTHDIDHNHAAFNTASGGGHDHDVRFLNVYNPGAGAAYGAHVNWSGTISGTTTVNGTADGAHAHSIDVPLSSGLVSGNASVTHNHTIDMPAFTGDTTSTGTDTEYRPPFLVLNYIIRCDG